MLAGGPVASQQGISDGRASLIAALPLHALRRMVNGSADRRICASPELR
jgi:hypothetical protein